MNFEHIDGAISQFCPLESKIRRLVPTRRSSINACAYLYSLQSIKTACVYVTARRHIINTDQQRLHCLIFHTDFLTSLLVFFANKNPESLKHLPGIVFKKHANHSDISRLNFTALKCFGGGDVGGLIPFCASLCAKRCCPNAAANIRILFEPMSLHFPDPPPAPPPSSPLFPAFKKKKNQAR